MCEGGRRKRWVQNLKKNKPKNRKERQGNGEVEKPRWYIKWNALLRLSFQVLVEDFWQEMNEICAFSLFIEKRSSCIILATFLNTKFISKPFPCPLLRKKIPAKRKKTPKPTKSHPKLFIVRKCRSERNDSCQAHWRQKREGWVSCGLLQVL